VLVVNRTRGLIIADQVEMATSFWARARGLIGRRSLSEGFGLAIIPCQAIHMAFVAMPLDIAHVDRNGRIVQILHGIKPWRLGPIVLQSAWVVELPSGTVDATGTRVGDLVELVKDERNSRNASISAEGAA